MNKFVEKSKSYLKKLIKILSLKQLKILPAYLSYSFVLAIIPLLTILVFVVGLFGISIDTVISIINDMLPSYASRIVIAAISGKNFDLSVGILNIITFIIAANGMYAIVSASNDLYKVEESSIVHDRLKSLLILLVIIFAMLFLVIVPVLGDKIITLLGNYKVLDGVMNNILLIYHAVKWPITFLLIFFNIKYIYKIAPSKKIDKSDTTLGAFITTVGWVSFTAFFSYYLEFFAKYDLIYGSLASIIVLLIWMYILSFILILGIVINTMRYNNKK